jgi:hypothetical protein
LIGLIGFECGLDDGFGEDVRLFHADAFEDEDDEGSLY